MSATVNICCCGRHLIKKIKIMSDYSLYQVKQLSSGGLERRIFQQ